ncbi:MAG: HD domain-containing protein [Chitinivibrionales bacterium]|nr:HD domain-containing protein [Chitinivibrionales bacterium]
MEIKKKSTFKIRKNLPDLPEITFLRSLYSKIETSPVAASKNCSQKYTECIQKVKVIFESARDHEFIQYTRQLPFTTIFTLAEMILLTTKESPDIFLEVMRPEYSSEYIPCHCLNVAFLSCKIGIEYGLPYKQLIELCVAAILHDIGMVKLNKTNYLHERTLSDEERFKIEEHPIIGWNFLKELREEFPWLLKVVLEEHKRENNQGYPQQVNGDLHEYSKIVGLCDSYEALSHARIFRKAFHPTDAMKMTIEGGKTLFAKEILRAMIDALAIYPVGSLVQLNIKKMAQVIQSVEGAPMKPIVQLIEEQNQTIVFTSETIDLSLDNAQFITNIVYTDDYKIPNR